MWAIINLVFGIIKGLVGLVLGIALLIVLLAGLPCLFFVASWIWEGADEMAKHLRDMDSYGPFRLLERFVGLIFLVSLIYAYCSLLSWCYHSTYG